MWKVWVNCRKLEEFFTRNYNFLQNQWDVNIAYFIVEINSLLWNGVVKSMWNTMECKRDSFSGALGGARETNWDCVSHRINCRFFSARAVNGMPGKSTEGSWTIFLFLSIDPIPKYAQRSPHDPTYVYETVGSVRPVIFFTGTFFFPRTERLSPC